MVLLIPPADARGRRSSPATPAPLFIIQRALPLLADNGRIINISSADTRITLPDELAYSMTKGAVNVLSRTLADALGARGITVNAVAPGVTDTGKLAALEARPELKAGTEAVTALGRIGQPADIADAVAFLASHDARWITGQVIDASGGTFLGPTGLRNMMSALTGK
jgi:3-oxoacyl-[acyl-carrier protein] reductase